MLLSIVECDDYRNSHFWERLNPKINKINEHIEIVGPVKGPSVAIMRNRGAQYASGQWIFFKDADCQISESAILKFCQEMDAQPRHPKVVGGVYRVEKGRFLPKVYNCIQRNWVLSGIDGEKSECGFPAKKLLGGALLVCRKTFLSVDGFSESIGWGGEELEFTNRVREKGYSTTVSFRILVMHKNPLNFLGFMKRAWFQNFNPGRFGFDQNKSFKDMKIYFRSPIVFWPPILTFFCVAGLANASGVVNRKLRLIWK